MWYLSLCSKRRSTPKPEEHNENHDRAIRQVRRKLLPDGARAAHEASLGGADRECGDCDSMGWYASLVVGKRYTFLVVEDGDGFVDVEIFTNGDRAIETNWNAYLKMEEEAYEAQVTK